MVRVGPIGMTWRVWRGWWECCLEMSVVVVYGVIDYREVF